MQAILKNTLFVCVIGLVTSGQATAYANLVSTTPPINGTVAVSPSELALRFAEALDVKFSGVKIVGPDNVTIGTGTVSFADGTKRILIAPILSTLVNGTYSVHWHILSKDGHESHGNHTFNVKPH